MKSINRPQVLYLALDIFREELGETLAQSYWSMYNSALGVIMGMAVRANPDDKFDEGDRRKTMELLAYVDHMLKYIRQELNVTDQEMNNIERPGFMPPI